MDSDSQDIGQLLAAMRAKFDSAVRVNSDIVLVDREQFRFLLERINQTLPASSQQRASLVAQGRRREREDIVRILIEAGIAHQVIEVLAARADFAGP